MTPRVAGFKSEYPAGLRLECMAGFVGIRTIPHDIGPFIISCIMTCLPFAAVPDGREIGEPAVSTAV
ncbi:hypothetical protein AE618_11250 [Bosea vaviloviae]|uniref:Uncharacterized protein n=1 Tax=Bosea vaviloviae TaxID=1526658 RepID=A0A0N0MBG3_9HYPH|nr:hypothetical protein AE618_11250 [Bosea vaviloviae]